MESLTFILLPGFLVKLNCLKAEFDLISSECSVLTEGVKADDVLLAVLFKLRLGRCFPLGPGLGDKLAAFSSFIQILLLGCLSLIPVFLIGLDVVKRDLVLLLVD